MQTRDKTAPSGFALPEGWHSKRYYSLDGYMKNTFGHKVNKVAIDAGFTCPNRDGTLNTRGCIFCSEGGSGEFAVSFSSINATEPYIAYFQAYTCTYGPAENLEVLYRQALNQPLVLGISIATRPDCLPESVLNLLKTLKEDYPDKLIWIELGLQTIHEQTARYIRRGYSLSCFYQAVCALNAIHIPVIVHIILGLPGETEEMMLSTIHYLGALPIFGIKLQLLHVLKGTDLVTDYEAGIFSTLTEEEYLRLLIRCIEHLPPHIVIHRVTGDGPKDLLIAPLWSRNKRGFLNALHHRMKLENSYQGKHWKGKISYGTGTTDTL